jgi:hypothetical protein
MLNIQEQNYFNNIVNSITENLDVKIPIIAYDHDLLKGEGKEALGCAWSENEGVSVYKITIDEFFIQECYNDYLWNNKLGGYPKLVKETLEETVCHEIAHIMHWRHGKKHRELTNRLLNDYKANLV